LGTRAIIVDEKLIEIGRHNHPTKNKTLNMALTYRNPFVHSSIMFRKNSVTRLGGYSTSKNIPPEDYELWNRIKSHGKIANLSESLVIYTKRTNSFSSIFAHDILVNLQNIVFKNLIKDVGLVEHHARDMSIFFHPINEGDSNLSGRELILFYLKMLKNYFPVNWEMIGEHFKLFCHSIFRYFRNYQF
jgi:hypothetical protein